MGGLTASEAQTLFRLHATVRTMRPVAMVLHTRFSARACRSCDGVQSLSPVVPDWVTNQIRPCWLAHVYVPSRLRLYLHPPWVFTR